MRTSFGWIAGAAASTVAAVVAAGPALAAPTAENTFLACQDAADNDEDGLTDCADADCTFFKICMDAAAPPAEGSQPVGAAENTFSACQDAVDNDQDGLTDCADADCTFFKICEPGGGAPPPEEAKPVGAEGSENTFSACQDEEDNDEDGAVDCADAECSLFMSCQAAKPGGATPAEPAAPRKRSKGGIGLYFAPTFILWGKHDMQQWRPLVIPMDETWDYSTFTPAFGIFGEAAPVPFFAIGAEVFLAFPEVEKAKPDGSPVWYRVSGYERDVWMQAMIRIKFPIPAGRYVAPYPILGGGLDLYVVRPEGGNSVTYLGGAAIGGFGIEFYPVSFVTPYLELRYSFGYRKNKAEAADGTYKASEWIMTHGIVMQIGIRFI